MIDQGVVQSSTSPWNSPLFLVPKKDNTWRPVIDHRKLNSVTVANRFPLPVLTDLLQSLGEHNTVFSSLDLLSGYWQVPLAPNLAHLLPLVLLVVISSTFVSLSGCAMPPWSSNV